MDQSRATTRPPVAARPIVARAWERVRIGVLVIAAGIAAMIWSPDWYINSGRLRDQRAHMPPLFEISTREVTSALRKARNLPYLKSATIFGRAIHALVDDHVTSEHIVADLAAKGVQVEEIRPLVANLEDVFVELTVRRQREMGEAVGA